MYDILNFKEYLTLKIILSIKFIQYKHCVTVYLKNISPVAGGGGGDGLGEWHENMYNIIYI